MARAAYDIVVCGATGFTGRLVAEYMAAQYQTDCGVVWAIAGRSLARLNELRAELPENGKPALLVYDAADPVSVTALVRQARVVLSTVGPFALHGRPLVEACVRLGRSYVDITGEAFWVRDMMDSYEAEAKSTGARIVSCCGFDSVPSDLGVLFLAEHVRERYGEPLGRVSAVARMSGGVSGGTIASMANIMSSSAAMRASAEPFLLCDGPDRARAPSEFERDRRGLSWDAMGRTWTVPFIMAGVNTRVVRRSQSLRSYGSGFEYNEAMPVSGRFAGFVTLTVLGLSLVLLYFRVTRWLLQRFVLPAQGSGPSAERRAAGRFRFVHSTTLSTGQVVRVAVAGGDPGYGETAKMVAEAAVCAARLTPDRVGGFFTPATLLGYAYIKQLQARGMTFEVLDNDATR